MRTLRLPALPPALCPTLRPALAPIVAGLVASLAAPAWAFFEDVCYLPNQAGMANCTPLPASCSLTEPVSAACRNDALASFQNVNNAQKFDTTVPPRSTVHVDATHLLAQAVGFPASSAYWIAAYDEASDRGQFAPVDAVGQPLANADALRTVTVDGIVRGNLANGGIFFHFNAPSTQAASTNGLYPVPTDPIGEPFLAHLRRWAMGQKVNTAAAPDCMGGLTTPTSVNGLTSYALGPSCFVNGTLQGKLALFGGFALPIGPIATGAQVVATAAATGAQAVTSDQFDTYVGAHAADARIGIYMHVLADRVSHHVCTDAAHLSEPTSGGAFTENFDNPGCVQSLHTLRHEYETGVPFAKLSPQDQTTPAALSIVYDELLAFAQARGIAYPQAGDSSVKAALLAAVSTALQQPAAPDRVNCLAAVACNAGLQPFPGSPACGGQ